MSELSADVSVKVPEIDTIFLTSTQNDAVVSWAEEHALNWVGVPDECLEEVGECLLSFIVPDLEERVLTTSNEETGVV